MLPLDIERDYRAFRAQIIHDVDRVAVPKLAGYQLRRLDAEDDPHLLELAALLGISAAALVNKDKLRAKLKRLGQRLSVQKQVQLSALLGRWVNDPGVESLVDDWVETQVVAVGKSVDNWLGRAAVSLGALSVTHSLTGALLNQAFAPEQAQSAVAATTAGLAVRARAGASASILSLNTALLGAVSVGAGVGSYQWITEDDDVVRDNHAALHFTVQQWANPPAGGGTKEDESGHPGSGFGCRCEAQPLAASLPS